MLFNKRMEVLKFRLRQESSNLKYYLKPPQALPVVMRPLLPAAKGVVEVLRQSKFEKRILPIADQILEHRFPLLGGTVETGAKIEWRKDYASGLQTGTGYFRFIPYLDPTRAGDHKNIFELNRHQHLVLLAQAGLFSGKNKYWKELNAQLDSWFAQNPYGRGINWTSSLEVALRSLSWIWLLHLGRDQFDAESRKKLIQGLFQHGIHLENNLSVGGDPGLHLLGEAVALHAIGTLFPAWTESGRWSALGASVVAQEAERQIGSDGAHFEQSTYLHLYALDMLLFHAVLCESNLYKAKLAKMAEYLESVLGPARCLTPFGDEDGGRFFHPFGRHDHYGRATLGACAQLLKMDFAHDLEDLAEQAAWWLGPKALLEPAAAEARGSRLFRDVGMASLLSGGAHIMMDAGPFGPAAAAHSHADSLSITLRRGAEEILIDSGTFTYVGDMAERNYFRGTGAHNTVRIDHRDQAEPHGPFGWSDVPNVKIIGFESTEVEDYIVAECHYRGFRHRRRLLFRKRVGLILLCDLIDGERGVEHEVEQIWRSGEIVKLLLPGVFQIGEITTLLLPGKNDFSFDGWRSREFGVKERILVVRQIQRGVFPIVLPAAINLLGKKEIRFNVEGETAEFLFEGVKVRLGS